MGYFILPHPVYLSFVGPGNINIHSGGRSPLYEGMFFSDGKSDQSANGSLYGLSRDFYCRQYCPYSKLPVFHLLRGRSSMPVFFFNRRGCRYKSDEIFVVCRCFTCIKVNINHIFHYNLYSVILVVRSSVVHTKICADAEGPRNAFYHSQQQK